VGARFQRISELFDHARQLEDAAARAAYLESECEPELLEEVAALLAAHESDAGRDSAILPGLGDAVAETWAATQQEPAAPELVEGFRIIERIGSGGMGTVYAAQQLEPARRVALKVLRPEADRERFRSEVLALARLQHAGIAQILLSGECATPMGNVPFLAMELIDGVPVDKFARALDEGARIELVIRVCEAVAHAHRRGIIHRDLKPNNILVTRAGQPKVLDFGLAMATDDSDDGFARQTRTGHLVGTLAYMSPEQAAGSRDMIDTRSDVYALGVLAYEILTGRLPHSLDDLPLQRALRTLTDDEPEAPPDLRGDLWVILRKALAKDPERRYGGAAALAADLRRYLDHEPIAARPPSAMYQARKFVRRHKAPVAGAAAAVLALVVGLVAALRAADREHEHRTRADLERDIARAAAAHAYLKAAVGDMATHNYAAARRNLAQVAPEFRDWEWDYLSGRLDRSVDFWPLPEGITPLDIQFARKAHPDIAGPRERILGHALRVEQDLEKKTARLIDTRAPDRAPIELTGVPYAVLGARVGPLGKSLALRLSGSSRRSQRIAVYEPSGGAPRFTLPAQVGHDGQFAYDPSGTRIVYGGFAGTLVLFDIVAGKRLYRRYTHSHDEISAVAFGPGDRIATGGFDRAIQIMDSRDGRVLHRLRGHNGPVSGLVFSRDGKMLVSAGYDGTIRAWDLESRQVRDVIAVPHLIVRWLALSEDERELWALCDDGFRRWRIDESRLSTFRFHDNFVYGVAFHPDGRTLASGAYKGGIRIIDTRRGTLLKKADNVHVWGLAFAPNGDLYTETARIAAPAWDFEQPQRLPGHGRDVAISPDGSRVIAGSKDAALQLYRPAEGRVEAEWPGFKERIEALAFSPDGGHVAIAGRGGFLQVRSVPDGAIRFERSGGPELNAVAFHPSRPLLACAGLDAIVRIWDVENDTLHRQLEGHTARIWTLSFHPSGTRLFSGGHDATIRVWDPETGLEKLRIDGHDNYVYALDLSPDGTTLATGSGDFTVRLWSTRSMRARWKEAGK
jgi:WD40 repeat protein/predicted Ser/Thr protein kinase